MPWSKQCGKVMKKPEEYSKNPNTIRARARKARLDPYQREVEQGKAGDRKAVSRAWKIWIESEEYKAASPQGRKAILVKVEQDVMERRRTKGYDAESRMKRFLRQDGGVAPDTSARTPVDAGRVPVANRTDYNPGQLVDGRMEALLEYNAEPKLQPHPIHLETQESNKSVPTNTAPYQAVSSIGATEFHTDDQRFRNGIQLPAIVLPQNGYSYGPSSINQGTAAQTQAGLSEDARAMAQLHAKVRECEYKMAQMESTIQELAYELKMTNSTISTQCKLMKEMHALVRLSHLTHSAPPSNEVEPADPAQKADKLRIVASGVKMLAEVAADIYTNTAGTSNDGIKQE